MGGTAMRAKVKAQAERLVKKQTSTCPRRGGCIVKTKTQRILDSTKDNAIYPLIGTSYQKCKENELNLGLDLQGRYECNHGREPGRSYQISQQ